MLVLTRKLGESIVIAGNITVQVVEIEGNRVRLGITAPADVGIRRAELAPRSDARAAKSVGSERVPVGA